MNWQARTRMSGNEFARAYKAFGLSQAAMARWLDISERTARRYVTQDVRIPVAHATLIRLVRLHNEQPIAPPYEGVRAKRRKEKTDARFDCL